MNKLIVIILTILPFYGAAQVDWENPRGAIKSEEIVIEKDKQLTLPTVSRRFTSITVEPVSIDTMAIKYMPKDITIELPKIPVKLRPRTMKSEALDKTYWANFKLGYGSYVSPFVQADVASKRNDEYAVALHFRHFSSARGPVDNRNSGLSNTDGYVSGKVFLNKATLGASAGAKFDKFHLYGYDAAMPIPESKSIEQNLSTYSMAINITDNDAKNDFYYQVNAGSYFFNAKDLDWKESDFYANIRTDIKASGNLKIKILGDLHIANQNYALSSQGRLLYMVKPIGVYSMDAFDFELGAGIYGTKDSINNYDSKLYITPHIVARYTMASGQRLSAGIKGDVTWQSARTRFDRNPYLGASTVINNEVKPIDAFIEINGKLAPKVDFSFGYHAALYKVFGQYVNNATDQSTFYIDYRTENNLIHTLNGQFDFITSKNLLLSAYGEYLIFDFKTIDNAYHLPKVDVGFKAKFNLENKFDAELSLAYLDGIYAFDANSASEIKLNPILDMNISASYKINSTFAAFVRMQNILGNRYQYFYNYPAKGFQALAGISITL
ncbi:MAG: hypothetical protein L3J06_03255 [Cyclobacteriaceae bacterium]|nr:hypothetical protein [Cyclobacteriaceae bacterium]